MEFSPIYILVICVVVFLVLNIIFKALKIAVIIIILIGLLYGFGDVKNILTGFSVAEPKETSIIYYEDAADNIVHIEPLVIENESSSPV